MPARVHLADPGRRNPLLVINDPADIARTMASGWSGAINLTGVDHALWNIKVADIVAVQPVRPDKGRR